MIEDVKTIKEPIDQRVLTWFRNTAPPLRDRRFWAIQFMVLTIEVSHIFFEEKLLLDSESELYLLSISIFLIPVVYAAISFGRKGSIPTAFWALLLSIPEIFGHGVITRIGTLTQFGIIIVIATIVANRVDSENIASEEARESNLRLLKSKENLEIYIALATEAQEEERRRLSRELHDETLQSLVGALVEIAAVSKAENFESQKPRLLRIQVTLEEIIINVRRYCKDLRPSLLDDLGLIDAIDWLANDLQNRSKIQIAMKIIGEPNRLPSSDELLIFRIVQEALHNVERHSGATYAEILLLFKGRILTVSIGDNGCGLSPKGPPTEAGLGLRGIDERTKLLKGTVRIESIPNSGTKITLEVPHL